MTVLARAGVARFLTRRLAQAAPTVLAIIVINFLVLHLTPGDIVDVLAGEAGAATPEYVAMLRQRFGLDRSLPAQLASYVWNVVNLDLGFSFRHNMTVLHLVRERLPATLLLMGASISIAVAIGLVLGVTAARHVNRPADGAIAVVALLSYATPTFWIGLMLIVLFSVKLGWLPSDGSMTVGANLSGFALVRDRLDHLILPALALASFFIAVYARLVRASMLEVQRQDFMRTAHAKGLHPFFVQLRHALRNALIPVTTVAGMHLGNLLGGAVVIESLFGWPGMGRLALEAVLARDFSVLLGVLLLSSLLVILANMLIDLLHAWLDPRIGAA